MKILLTGATGFIGRYTLDALLADNHQVIITDINLDQLKNLAQEKEITFIHTDLERNYQDLLKEIGSLDLLIHLAWPHLTNFRALEHLTESLPANIRFLTAAMESGLSHLMVAGTCFEYGMQSGPLSEEMHTDPTLPYAIAKDALRRAIEPITAHYKTTLQWLRIFYPYGEGQKASSLFPVLQRIVANKERTFDMSSGEQLRDYIHVKEIANIINFLCNTPSCKGIINCCTGKPISVRRFVENFFQKHQMEVKINFGKYPVPDYEPLAFWGIPDKLMASGYKDIK